MATLIAVHVVGAIAVVTPGDAVTCANELAAAVDGAVAVPGGGDVVVDGVAVAAAGVVVAE